MEAYLSIVVTARNDDYGGKFLERMGNFLSVLAALSERCALDAELVVVEWNPPADRPRLAEALDWPTGGGHLTVRLIEVPAEVHRTLEGAGRMPMFEYVAKNTGVRRARAPFVLVVNPDLIFNQALVAYLAGRSLREDCFYRIDRLDIEGRPPLQATVQEKLAYCGSHVRSRGRYDYTMPVRPDGSFAWDLASWRRRTRSAWKRWWRGMDYRLYTWGAGDFFLMSREQWHRLRGFPQLTTFTGLDSYLCYVAFSGGLKQKVLGEPMRIYHQEHGRLEQRSRPNLDYGQYRRDRRQMLRERRPILYNDEQWGLGGLTLPEQQLR